MWFHKCEGINNLVKGSSNIQKHFTGAGRASISAEAPRDMCVILKHKSGDVLDFSLINTIKKAKADNEVILLCISPRHRAPFFSKTIKNTLMSHAVPSLFLHYHEQCSLQGRQVHTVWIPFSLILKFTVQLPPLGGGSDCCGTIQVANQVKRLTSGRIR